MLGLTADLSPRARLGVRLAVAVVVGLYVGQAGQVLTGWGGSGATHVILARVQPVGLVVSAFVVLARAVLVRAERTAWALLGGGIVAWILGSATALLRASSTAAASSPSISDALWLAIYPLAYAALVLLARARTPRFPPSVWLDGVLGASAVAAFGGGLVLPRIVAAASGSPAAMATNLAYPLADLVLVGLVIGVFALSGWRAGPSWGLIGLGLVVLAAADTTYVASVATGTYDEGSLQHSTYSLAFGLLALAAWQPQRRATVRLEGWVVLLVPALFTLAALGLLVYDHAGDVDGAGILLAAATILLALARTALTFREVRALADSRRQALTDELTGLGNRRLLRRELQAAIAAARTEGGRLAVLLLDLDAFKELNDTLGHRAGDLLLAQVGPRLAAGVPPGALLTRLGGDEFALVLPGVDGAEAALAVARAVRAALEAPYELEGVSARIDGSVGVALFPDHGDDMDTLLQRADAAMYQAKQRRTGCALYAPERDAHGHEHLALVHELRTALERDELVLHFQPKAHARTGEVVGVEALVRWQHPTRGLLGPHHFLGLAEQAGLMPRMTVRILHAALEQAAAWRRAGHDLAVAVNVSTVNLLDAALPDVVATALAAAGVPASRLTLEITEDTLMADPERAAAVLAELRALGVHVSLDDYGTGYSSLAYLRDLAADELKIDRSFVSGIAQDEALALIVRSTIDLAHGLGLRVVAEGIEDAGTWDALAALGCDIVQGYHLARPAPAAEIGAWLAARPRGVRRDAIGEATLGAPARPAAPPAAARVTGVAR
jgi:diguanylate cyclase